MGNSPWAFEIINCRRDYLIDKDPNFVNSNQQSYICYHQSSVAAAY